MKTVSTEEIRELDRRTIDEGGIFGDRLMEYAGIGIANMILDIMPTRMQNSILMLAGPGNNGGDVFAAATFLSSTDLDVTVWVCCPIKKIKGDAEYHLKKMIRAGITPHEVSAKNDLFLNFIPALIVDGLLGTGSSGAPRGMLNDVIKLINRFTDRSFILSIDIPSGINADTGIAEGAAVKAALTATLAAPKTGLIRQEALPYVGRVEVIDINIPNQFVKEALGCTEAELITPGNLHLPSRTTESHKGNYGRVLLIGGSTGTSGAIAMAARAALRCGSGLVHILTPHEVYPLVAQAAGPEIMVHPFTELSKLPLEIQTHWMHMDAILIGPGFTASNEIKAFTEIMLSICTMPLILDAGALCIDPDKLPQAAGPVVLTPHPGEYRRIFDTPADTRWDAARSAADKTKQTVILKGAGTIVAHPERKLAVNMTGNPGMATAGCGDVLAGMLTSFAGQNIPPAEAAKTAVYLHGLAGDIAVELLTPETMTATDIISYLPNAFQAIRTYPPELF